MLWKHLRISISECVCVRACVFFFFFSRSLIPLAHSPLAMTSPLYLFMCLFICIWLLTSISDYSTLSPPVIWLNPSFTFVAFTFLHTKTHTNSHAHILHQIVDPLNSTCAAIIKLSIGGAFFRSYFTSSYSLCALILGLVLFRTRRTF